MRRPHPYLAIALVAAAVVLATAAMLACPAKAEIVNYNDGCNACWRDTETGMGGCTLLACVGMGALRTTPIPPRSPVPTPTPAPAVEPTCLPLIHGAIVWPGSPECTAERGTDTLNVPTQDRFSAIRYFTVRILSNDLANGSLSTDATQAERQAALNRISETVPVYYDRPLFGTWAATPPALPPNCGNAYCGCASGVGSWPPKIDVSQRLGRVEKLVAWDTPTPSSDQSVVPTSGTTPTSRRSCPEWGSRSAGGVSDAPSRHLHLRGKPRLVRLCPC